jgi:hypothetical protein
MAGNVRQSKPVREMATLISPNSPDSSNGGVQVHQWHPFFDWEPHLPIQCCTTDEDIERGRIVRDEAMKREEANYFQKQDVAKGI